MRREPISEKKVLDVLAEWPDLFEPVVPELYRLGFGCYDIGMVYYVINRGQTGIHKVCSIHTDYREAKKALEAFDPVLRPHTEIRQGLLIEGNPVEQEKEKTGG